MIFKSGDKVRISKLGIKAYAKNSKEHLLEFKGCVGIVEGPVVWGEDQVGPELDVRWQPSKLRYAYHPSHLELVE